MQSDHDTQCLVPLDAGEVAETRVDPNNAILTAFRQRSAQESPETRQSEAFRFAELVIGVVAQMHQLLEPLLDGRIHDCQAQLGDLEMPDEVYGPALMSFCGSVYTQWALIAMGGFGGIVASAKDSAYAVKEISRVIRVSAKIIRILGRLEGTDSETLPDELRQHERELVRLSLDLDEYFLRKIVKRTIRDACANMLKAAERGERRRRLASALRMLGQSIALAG